MGTCCELDTCWVDCPRVRMNGTLARVYIELKRRGVNDAERRVRRAARLKAWLRGR